MNAGYKLVMAFISLFIAVVLISVLTDQTIVQTTPIVITNESVSIASARGSLGNLTYATLIPLRNVVTDWRSTSDAPVECSPGSSTGTYAFTLRNQTNALLTRGVHYNISNGGYLQVANVVVLNNSMANTTYASYDYCPSDYQVAGFGRSMLNMIGGFLALMCFGIAIFFMYDIYKDFKI